MFFILSTKMMEFLDNNGNYVKINADDKIIDNYFLYRDKNEYLKHILYY